ncbi:FadR family transcriptional regulator [Salinibacterium sp. NG22]|uniref:FadR/GntR family transcriptional regulator n=1 Tax=Salinibacterium sp. NG22 TaxID=2792040 RepID=UPI0018CD6C29|nr:FCD domain-containing protein [Salinibacterium sp. NG22]MBH0110910.1 FadR family transcriptional regulator [Salinibacterium sp. NG22]
MSGQSADIEPSDFSQHRFLTNLLEDKALGELVTLLLAKEPGQQIPSERELAETLSISRTALRDRISRLVSLGILQRREREGTFLTGIQPDSISDTLILSLMSSQLTIDSLISVRYALERHAGMAACDTRDEQALDDLAKAVQRMRDSDDGRELFEADNAFHHALFRASGESGLIFFSQMLHSVLRGTVRYIALEDDRETLRKVHGDVLDAILTQDRDAAGAAIDEHFAWLETLRANDTNGPSDSWLPKAIDSRD